MLEEPKKKKTRKPAMKNQEVIDKLYKAGYMTQSNIKDKTTEFSKIWKEYSRYNNPYYCYGDLGIWPPKIYGLILHIIFHLMFIRKL
jgi:hypothetical protein